MPPPNCVAAISGPSFAQVAPPLFDAQSCWPVASCPWGRMRCMR